MELADPGIGLLGVLTAVFHNATAEVVLTLGHMLHGLAKKSTP